MVWSTPTLSLPTKMLERLALRISTHIGCTSISPILYHYIPTHVNLSPCSGSGNNCKPYATQIAEIGSTFSANSMKIGTLWIDIESDLTCQNVSFLQPIPSCCFTSIIYSGIMVSAKISHRRKLSLLQPRHPGITSVFIRVLEVSVTCYFV